MRIDPNNAITRQVAAEKIAKSKEKSGASAPVGQDKASFSKSSLSLQALAKAATSTPTARQERVSALQDKFRSGNYEPDPKIIAHAMLDEAGD